ncbi:MAG TPA: class I SAM-dependent methyltransferase [Tepidisphaeraceae bacterium]|nr:class I SAM-dependent methyltransferase [Tepidisphaeraceae bacterium]
MLEEAQETMGVAQTSLRQSKEGSSDGGLYVETLGAGPEEKQAILDLAAHPKNDIDPVVSYMVGATNGIAYKNLIGHLQEYPIPELRLPSSNGKIFLDIGCSWGRWCVAAARKGYRVVGIDPSLGAIMAAKRVARQLQVDAQFIVGDARFLPFSDSSIDCAFSYSVIQHFSRDDAALVIADIGRVLKENGISLVQMPSKFGLRCLQHQLRRRFREATGFEVRYWSLPALRRLFSSRIGHTKFSVDCYFGIGLQFSDLRLMSPILKVVVTASEGLRRLSRVMPPLKWVADSVYVLSVKSAQGPL